MSRPASRASNSTSHQSGTVSVSSRRTHSIATTTTTAAFTRPSSRNGLHVSSPSNISLPLDTLLSSALASKFEKAPSRIAPHAHRPSAAGDVHGNEVLSPSRMLDGDTPEQRAKTKREEELREQIRQLDLHDIPEPYNRKATNWARIHQSGERQYQHMDRPHANPMW